MLKATCHLHSADESSLSFSRYISEPLKKNETHDEWEDRVWRDRCHYNSNGNVIIPRSMFRKALIGAACYLGEKIVGRGNKTYASKFIGGVRPMNSIVLPETRATVQGDWFLMSASPSNPKSGKVMRFYPMIAEWRGKLDVMILDPDIPQDVFEHHLRAAGQFIGIGRWRPANGGENGAFVVEKIEFAEV